ncbi:ATP-binding protein [Kineococcus gynurae]|uniref:histidine kinase n=1 Tax=Kineococcus gynurae TaxID=452979 RepID=A0ABV5LXN8_9ACTN
MRRWLRPVRAKVLLAVTLAAATGLLISGTVSYVVQRDSTDDRLTVAMNQEIAELRELASGEAGDGVPYASVEELFRDLFARDVPEDNQSAVGFVQGGPTIATAAPRPFELEDLREVQKLVAAMGPDSPVARRDLDAGAVGTVRIIAVPVVVPGAAEGRGTGVYVVGHALDRELLGVRDNARTFAVVAFGALLLVIAVGWLVIWRLLRPLDELHETAVGIGADDLARRARVHGDDDVADVARAFNAMLERLEAGFAGQRQFLDDAGHELRTPLTIVQGHLELLDASDPGEVLETRDLVLDELARMARLVDDLTLLATSRSPDFVVLRPVRTGRLLDDAAEKVRALGDRTWRVDARVDVECLADPQRLTQALLQLVANAVKFSAPGDEVALGSAVETRDGRRDLLLWARDTGPGIAPEDTRRIFERFGRAETGRGVEGSGLGLSIVSAIAEAHGGSVEVDSRLGAGATFTLRLPLDPDPKEYP